MNKEAGNTGKMTETVPGRIFATGLKELKQLVEDADDDTIIRVVFMEDEPDERDWADKAE